MNDLIASVDAALGRAARRELHHRRGAQIVFGALADAAALAIRTKLPSSAVRKGKFCANPMVDENLAFATTHQLGVEFLPALRGAVNPYV